MGARRNSPAPEPAGHGPGRCETRAINVVDTWTGDIALGTTVPSDASGTAAGEDDIMQLSAVGTASSLVAAIDASIPKEWSDNPIGTLNFLIISGIVNKFISP